jgi:putative colanic acid biosynthesis acetyltransferase WcaF
MKPQQLKIDQNRRMIKYGTKEQLLRVLWGACKPFFHLSPRPFFVWRCFLLRLFGAKVGRHVHIYNSAVIYMPWNFEIGDWSSIGESVLIYNLGKICIGKRSTISHRAHLCAGTHNYNDLAFPLIKLPITVADQVWICTDSFIGPGISVGEGAVVGACAVVVKDVGPWQVVGGNPAKFLKNRVIDNNLN